MPLIQHHDKRLVINDNEKRNTERSASDREQTVFRRVFKNDANEMERSLSKNGLQFNNFLNPRDE